MRREQVALIWKKLCKLSCKAGLHDHSAIFEIPEGRVALCMRCGHRKILELKRYTLKGYCDSHKQGGIKPTQIHKCDKENCNCLKED
jgi:hypothetical protein